MMKPQRASLKTYTVTWCPHCRAFKEWLDENKISYIDHDVDSDDEAWHRAMNLTGGIDIVPVAEVDGKALWGAFNDEFKERLKRLLEPS